MLARSVSPNAAASTGAKSMAAERYPKICACAQALGTSVSTLAPKTKFRVRSNRRMRPGLLSRLPDHNERQRRTHGIRVGDFHASVTARLLRAVGRPFNGTT